MVSIGEKTGVESTLVSWLVVLDVLELRSNLDCLMQYCCCGLELQDGLVGDGRHFCALRQSDA